MLLQIHEAQFLSYLKSTRFSAGLLINFKERMVKDDIKRFVLVHVQGICSLPRYRMGKNWQQPGFERIFCQIQKVVNHLTTCWLMIYNFLNMAKKTPKPAR